MGGFPLVHTFSTSLINHTFGVAHDAVVVPGAHRLEQLKTSDPCSTRAIQHNPHIFYLFAGNVQRVDQPGGTDHSGAVLVIMKDGNIHLFFQTLLDDKTFRRFDVFQINAAKRRTHQLDRINDGFGVFGIQFDVDRIYIREPFEQDRLAFHHRLGGKRTQIAKTQNRRSVRNNRYQVALVCIVIGGFRVLCDRLTRHSHAR